MISFLSGSVQRAGPPPLGTTTPRRRTWQQRGPENRRHDAVLHRVRRHDSRACTFTVTPVPYKRVSGLRKNVLAYICTSCNKKRQVSSPEARMPRRPNAAVRAWEPLRANALSRHDDGRGISSIHTMPPPSGCPATPTPPNPPIIALVSKQPRSMFHDSDCQNLEVSPSSSSSSSSSSS
jgi:hypothetical protein